MPLKPHVAVIGAGAFGGWTALYLLRRGARVTLLDAWGPGNSRSSSGGETRIIRGTYGPGQPYTNMVARALRLWDEHEARWGRKLLHRSGVLWMATSGDGQFERSSLPLLREAGIVYEELSGREVGKRWPQINVEDVRWAIHEPESGFLMARAACQAVLEGFLAEGGEYKQVTVLRHDLETGLPDGLTLSDGSRLLADQYVFACGPWLGELFPEAIGTRIRPTKQDVFFFGTPAGDDRFSQAKLPVWADHRDRFIYGIPAADGRGFKVADDTRGVAFDPTSGERVASEDGLKLGARLHRLPLSCAERYAIAGDPRLPIRKQSGQRSDHRSASGSGERLACWRRFRTRLQTWASSGRDAGRVGDETQAARSDIPVGAVGAIRGRKGSRGPRINYPS